MGMISMEPPAELELPLSLCALDTSSEQAPPMMLHKTNAEIQILFIQL